MYLCHDQDNFYIGARCYESDFSRLQANATELDGRSPWDDNIWFFFDTNFDKETYYQAIINSNGIVFDRKCSLKDGVSVKDLDWNGSWEIKSGKEENAWVLEMNVPKSQFASYNKLQWGFNFRRFQPGVNDAGYWSLPFGHDPTTFGILEFE